MRLESLQGLAAIVLVAVGCAVAAGWWAAMLAAGALLYLDYALDRWRPR